MRRFIFKIFTICALLNLCSPQLQAELPDPYDPTAVESFDDFGPNDEDQDKSADDLIREALNLQQDQKPLDSRTKLLRALRKSPKEFRVHMALSDYYMRYVGHFRLSLKYALQAENLFYDQYGPPPYSDLFTQAYHSDLYLLVSQARLNLDDYEGALEELNEFEKLGYYSASFPSSKAWILMKLGQMDEAIRVARVGLMAGANPGHTLNILGILLSMTGEPKNSLEVFKEALRYELSLGSLGNPATPLNNSGEVYKELFQEAKAINSWNKAIQLPDGCEHVLPSLNLALILIDQTDYQGAKRAMDEFEACFAQFPLKNGEEHKALVQLARGRLALNTGWPTEALENFTAARDRQQWFGKIGTSSEDLQAAVLVSSAMALEFQNSHLATAIYSSNWQWLQSLAQRVANSTKRLWLLNKTRHVLIEHLNQLEDLYIRHTDSMLEYPTFGNSLSSLPLPTVEMILKNSIDQEKRPEARMYYQAYLAEAYLANDQIEKGLNIARAIVPELRPLEDRQLELHVINLIMQQIDSESDEYRQMAYDAYTLAPASVRNYGNKLPVNIAGLTEEISDLLKSSSILIDNRRGLPFKIEHEFKDDKHVLVFSSQIKSIPRIEVSGEELSSALNDLQDRIFTRRLN